MTLQADAKRGLEEKRHEAKRKTPSASYVRAHRAEAGIH
jgi:hypothetical protein